MVDFNDIREVTDIRKNKNIFRDGYGNSEHLNMLALRKYNMSDLAILLLVVVSTILINKYVLTRK